MHGGDTEERRLTQSGAESAKVNSPSLGEGSGHRRVEVGLRDLISGGELSGGWREQKEYNVSGWVPGSMLGPDGERKELGWRDPPHENDCSPAAWKL